MGWLSKSGDEGYHGVRYNNTLTIAVVARTTL